MKTGIILELILAILLIGDVITTTIIINLGGKEFNIFMQPLVNNPLLHLTAKALIIICFLLICKHVIRKIKSTSDNTPNYFSTNSIIMIFIFWFAGVNIFNLTSIL